MKHFTIFFCLVLASVVLVYGLPKKPVSNPPGKDHSGPKWGTYIGYGDEGGSGAETIACDPAGNVYVGGSSTLHKNIATPNGLHPKFIGGNWDAYLAKFTSEGKVQWATYFGGDGGDDILGISAGTDGIYITGETDSKTGISVNDPNKSMFSGKMASFLAKFNFEGKLIWSTYISGDRSIQAQAITVGTDNQIYITGHTSSSKGVATNGAWQTTYHGREDAFVMKYSPDGKCTWATYYGGNGTDLAVSIAVNHKGEAYITGSTSSDSGISSNGAFQANLGGKNDAFLAKFSTTGQLAWATYFGGDSMEEAKSVALGPDDEVYITGGTASRSKIATRGAWQTKYGGGYFDIYLAKFHEDGKLDWATYYGRAGKDQGFSVAVDTANDVCLTGRTSSQEGFATPGCYKEVHPTHTELDAFLIKFNSNGRLLYSSFFGGDKHDEGWAMTFDRNNNLYFAGYTESETGITTKNAYQAKKTPKWGSGFLVRFVF